MSARKNLGSQFDGLPYSAPLKRMTTQEIGLMRSANTNGQTSVREWAAALPDSDRRASKIRGYIDRTGDIPGFLSVSPDHSMLMDGHHRFKEGEEAGIPYMHVLDDPGDPRFKTPN